MSKCRLRGDAAYNHVKGCRAIVEDSVRAVAERFERASDIWENWIPSDRVAECPCVLLPEDVLGIFGERLTLKLEAGEFDHCRQWTLATNQQTSTQNDLEEARIAPEGNESTATATASGQGCSTGDGAPAVASWDEQLADGRRMRELMSEVETLKAKVLQLETGARRTHAVRH